MERRDILRGVGGVTLTGLAGCIGTNPLAEDGAEKTGSKQESTASSKNETDTSPTETQRTTAETGLEVGKTLPDFTLQTVAETEVSLHPVQKPTVLFFMAAWCTSCKQEESNLKQVFQQYGNDVRIVSIDMDPDRDSMAELRQFKRQYGGDWVHAMGTQQLIRKYRLTSLDTTYILDRNGVTVHKDSNVTSVETFEQQLEALL